MLMQFALTAHIQRSYQRVQMIIPTLRCGEIESRRQKAETKILLSMSQVLLTVEARGTPPPPAIGQHSPVCFKSSFPGASPICVSSVGLRETPRIEK